MNKSLKKSTVTPKQYRREDDYEVHLPEYAWGGFAAMGSAMKNMFSNGGFKNLLGGEGGGGFKGIVNQQVSGMTGGLLDMNGFHNPFSGIAGGGGSKPAPQVGGAPGVGGAAAGGIGGGTTTAGANTAATVNGMLTQPAPGPGPAQPMGPFSPDFFQAPTETGKQPTAASAPAPGLTSFAQLPSVDVNNVPEASQLRSPEQQKAFEKAEQNKAQKVLEGISGMGGGGGAGGQGGQGKDRNMILQGLDLLDVMLNRKQQQEYDKLLRKMGSTDFQAVGPQESQGVYGNYTLNTGLGSNFQPGTQTPAQKLQYELGGEYTGDEEEINRLRKLGYDVELL